MAQPAVHTTAPKALSRRDALAAAALPLLLAGWTGATAPAAVAAAADTSSSYTRRGLGAYIKKKQLDPLDTYVPLVLEARDQLDAVGRAMLDQTAAARQLLRSGAFTGLRDNIRAIGEYAVVRFRHGEVMQSCTCDCCIGAMQCFALASAL